MTDELRDAARATFRECMFYTPAGAYIAGFRAGAAHAFERAAKVADAEAQDCGEWSAKYESLGEGSLTDQCQGGYTTAQEIARAIRALVDSK